MGREYQARFLHHFTGIVEKLRQRAKVCAVLYLQIPIRQLVLNFVKSKTETPAFNIGISLMGVDIVSL